MKTNKSTFLFMVFAITLSSCSLSNPQAPTPKIPVPSMTSTKPVNTAIPTRTELPTETILPPTETPTPPPPIVLVSDHVAGDGCALVQLNTAGWNPMSASYNSGSDPFYQFHDNEDGFYFNVEMYTKYGGGWTGQLGTFSTNCSSNGICVYLVMDDINPYLATTGEITIDTLSQLDGVLQKPVNILIKNVTLKPSPGSSSQGCFHVDEVSISIEK